MSEKKLKIDPRNLPDTLKKHIPTNHPIEVTIRDIDNHIKLAPAPAVFVPFSLLFLFSLVVIFRRRFKSDDSADNKNREKISDGPPPDFKVMSSETVIAPEFLIPSKISQLATPDPYITKAGAENKKQLFTTVITKIETAVSNNTTPSESSATPATNPPEEIPQQVKEIEKLIAGPSTAPIDLKITGSGDQKSTALSIDADLFMFDTEGDREKE